MHRCARREDRWQGLAGAYGTDLDGRCLGNVVARNTIIDNQPKWSMILPIRGAKSSQM
jgi:hypothetical protein